MYGVYGGLDNMDIDNRLYMVKYDFEDNKEKFNFQLAMTSAVGKSIKVDTNTVKVTRGRFAHICVEIDLTHIVVGKCKVQYVGLRIICRQCGCYGHLARNCSSNMVKTLIKLPPNKKKLGESMSERVW
uniref:CCHC-type domain-containing protein n=1 Tax=Glycine max TaxID=3847 RepID=A0A0R0FA40_SOYBN